MKVCPQCGKVLPDEVAFCGNCGASMAEVEGDRQPVPQGENVQPIPQGQNVQPIPQGQQPFMAQPDPGMVGAGLTKEAFLSLPQMVKQVKNTKTAGILCYVCGILTGVIGVAGGQYLSLVDMIILIVLGFFVHKKQSFVASVILLVYAIISMIVGLVANGMLGGWLILVAAIVALLATSKIKKSWQHYQQTGQILP